MSLALTIQFVVWETGLFWGEPNRRFHILQGKFTILGFGINLDWAVL
ncbi:unnamed protein product [marine sediment metagenome]|uniref:Uncharacterized protein n=1 Tax=marine sediment metagenome TaxID=412755 RepID=X1SNG6_9ZZZZ